jgi:hypothetical protein
MYDDDLIVKFEHPFHDGLIITSIVFGASALAFAILLGLNISGLFENNWAILPGVNMAVWAFMLITMWGWGELRRKAIINFWNSDRPLVRWRYTNEEWYEVKTERRKRDLEGIEMAPGCMAFLFGLIGLIAGFMIGIEEMENPIGTGLIGLLIGGGVGGVLGGLSYLGNKLSANWAYNKEERAVVALGEKEVLYGRQYFKYNGITRYFDQLTLEDGDLSQLVVKMEDYAWSKSSSKETWSIPVPSRMIDEVQAAIPKVQLGR